MFCLVVDGTFLIIISISERFQKNMIFYDRQRKVAVQRSDNKVCVFTENFRINHRIL